MKKSFLIVVAVIVASLPAAHAQWTVAAPGVEARQDQKNIFDVLKYTWEQAK